MVLNHWCCWICSQTRNWSCTAYAIEWDCWNITWNGQDSSHLLWLGQVTFLCMWSIQVDPSDTVNWHWMSLHVNLSNFLEVVLTVLAISHQVSPRWQIGNSSLFRIFPGESFVKNEVNSSECNSLGELQFMCQQCNPIFGPSAMSCRELIGLYQEYQKQGTHAIHGHDKIPICGSEQRIL